MIEFFRKIRQNMIKENKVSKYMLYAIGEIILVVIGILIALQCNNWNIQRVNRQLETKILKELNAEYQGKLNELNQKVKLRNIIIRSSAKILQLINDEDYIMSQDSLDILIIESALSPTYDASNSVTDELLNSGKLYLIQNEDLRKLILDWESELAKLDEEEQYGIHILTNSYLPYLFKHYPYNSLLTSILNEDSEIWKYIMKTTGETSFVMRKSKKHVDIEKLFNDITFESLVSYLNANWIISNMHSENLRTHIEKVFKIINSELDQ